jgi:translation elongation factor EF-1beta
MGNVITLFKVYTEPGNEEKVSAEIKNRLNPKGMQLEDIAFGIKVIKVMFVHDDSEGSSIIEEKLRKVNGVTEVEVADESLM